MGNYAKKVVFYSDCTLPSTHTDGMVLGMFRVPANRTVEVHKLKVLVDTISATLNAKLEFVEISNSDTIWASRGVTAALSAANDTAYDLTIVASKFADDSLPTQIAPSASERIFGFKLDQDAGVGIYCGEIDMTFVED